MSDWSTVFAVSVVLFLGIFVYLLYLDMKVRKLEK